MPAAHLVQKVFVSWQKSQFSLRRAKQQQVLPYGNLHNNTETFSGVFSNVHFRQASQLKTTYCCATRPGLVDEKWAVHKVYVPALQRGGDVLEFMPSKKSCAAGKSRTTASLDLICARIGLHPGRKLNLLVLESPLIACKHLNERRLTAQLLGQLIYWDGEIVASICTYTCFVLHSKSSYAC